MTTPKPDGAGPTMDIKPCPFCGNKMILQAVKPHRGLTLLCLGIDCPINGFEIRLMYWKRPWEILKSERAEAEKRIAAYRKVVGGLLHQMKIINGDNEKCVLPEYCLNHLLINEAERLMKEETK